MCISSLICVIMLNQEVKILTLKSFSVVRLSNTPISQTNIQPTMLSHSTELANVRPVAAGVIEVHRGRIVNQAGGRFKCGK